MKVTLECSDRNQNKPTLVTLDDELSSAEHMGAIRIEQNGLRTYAFLTRNEMNTLAHALLALSA